MINSNSHDKRHARVGCHVLDLAHAHLGAGSRPHVVGVEWRRRRVAGGDAVSSGVAEQAAEQDRKRLQEIHSWFAGPS